MVALYFAAFAFSVLLLILTLAATSQYRGNYHVLSTMTTAIVNFGYWQLAMSHNLEEALLANRIAYLDGTFLTLFMFLAVAQFCRIKVPAFMVTAMSIAGFVVLGLPIPAATAPFITAMSPLSGVMVSPSSLHRTDRHTFFIPV